MSNQTYSSVTHECSFSSATYNEQLQCIQSIWDHHEHPTLSLGTDIPTPYETTRVFGEKLLQSPFPYIRSLFCLGAYIQTYGINNGYQLVKSGKVPDTIQMKPHLFCLLENIHDDNTAKSTCMDLEQFRVAFLFAEQEAELSEHNELNLYTRSIAKHIRSDSIVSYCEKADYLIEYMEYAYPPLPTSVKKQMRDILSKQVSSMLRECNIVNLLHKSGVTPKGFLMEHLRHLRALQYQS